MLEFVLVKGVNLKSLLDREDFVYYYVDAGALSLFFFANLLYSMLWFVLDR